MELKHGYYHLIAILTVAIWGLTFISTKVLINHGLTPQEIFFYRFLIAYLGIWVISPKRLDVYKRQGVHRQYRSYPKAWTAQPDRGTFRTYEGCLHRIFPQSYPD